MLLIYTVNRGESGRLARAGREIWFLCLSLLEPSVLIHPVSPDPPWLTAGGFATPLVPFSTKTDFLIGLRQSMLSEVDWFTPMAWNTIGSSDSAASLDNFLLTFKFLVLKEVKIRESLEERGGGGGGGAASVEKPEDEEKRTKRESTTSLLHVNLDMQNQMLGSAVDAGLRKIRVLTAGSGVSTESSDPSTTTQDKEAVEEILEILFKVCEKRRRVLTELESLAGPSESLLNCKLMAAIYHFEVCAKSRRHSHMKTLLGEIGRRSC